MEHPHFKHNLHGVTAELISSCLPWVPFTLYRDPTERITDQAQLPDAADELRHGLWTEWAVAFARRYTISLVFTLSLPPWSILFLLFLFFLLEGRQERQNERKGRKQKTKSDENDKKRGKERPRRERGGKGWPRKAGKRERKRIDRKQIAWEKSIAEKGK